MTESLHFKSQEKVDAGDESATISHCWEDDKSEKETDISFLGKAISWFILDNVSKVSDVITDIFFSFRHAKAVVLNRYPVFQELGQA